MTLNGLATAILLINVILLLLVPRRWAMLPLLVGVLFSTSLNGLEFSIFHFSNLRILLLAGLIRVTLRGERFMGPLLGADWLILAWSAWGLFSGFYHSQPGAALVFRSGLMYDVCGTYFLTRIFLSTFQNIIWLGRCLAVLLIPMAAEMVMEKITFFNWYSLLGGVSATPQVRDGLIRAQGPFDHAILAGTVGALCVPLLAGIGKWHRKEALAGIGACLIIIYTSGSSGPIMTLLAGLGALVMWRYRRYMGWFKWMFIAGYIVLELIMKDPAYYIMARIDLTGSSSSWHRAALIESAVRHLNEWWWAGTDFTRHWMPTGVSWSPDHTDITNYFLHLGVVGGLPLMLSFMLILLLVFRYVGRLIRNDREEIKEFLFLIWSLGATLFALAVTGYFGLLFRSVLFLPLPHYRSYFFGICRSSLPVGSKGPR